MRGRLKIYRHEIEGELRVLNGNVLVRIQLVHLLDMHGQTTSGIESSGTHFALEVLRFLMLH